VTDLTWTGTSPSGLASLYRPCWLGGKPRLPVRPARNRPARPGRVR